VLYKDGNIVSLPPFGKDNILEKCFWMPLMRGTYGFGGVSYMWERGRKYTAKNGNGYKTGVLHHNLVSIGISPYVVPGDPLASFAKRYQREILGKAQR